MNRSSIFTWLLVLVGGTAIFTYALIRDIRYEKEYQSDLRNRVVGARLLKDGRDPYFYKWKYEDGIRYYDLLNFDEYIVSRVTVTPFMLCLLRPIVEWPEAAIARFWLALEYFQLLTITVICLLAAHRTVHKQTVIVLAVLFLHTNAWKEHVLDGQYYTWVPFLAALFYWCCRDKDRAFWGALAGLFATCLLLVRPNAVFFFLPFLLLLRSYKRQWLLAFAIFPLLAGGWILLDRHEHGAWQNYSSSLREHVKIHQGLPFARQYNEPDPKIRQWEGINMDSVTSRRAQETDWYYEEHGNVFLLFKQAFKRSLPVAVLVGAGLGAIGLSLLLFYFRHRPFALLTLEQVALFGFCLYMLSDLFSPFYRHQYPAVQWVFPLLLGAATVQGKYRSWLWLIFLGLLVSIFHIPYMKLRNTTGEYLFLFVLLALSLLPGWQPAPRRARLP